MTAGMSFGVKSLMLEELKEGQERTGYNKISWRLEDDRYDTRYIVMLIGPPRKTYEN